MTPKEAKNKIDKLTEELKHHNYLYYVVAEPIISDTEFDQKLKELEFLEKEFPEFVHTDSPTRQVGGAVSADFVTVPHKRRMMSLGNTYNEQELRDFDARIKKTTGGEVEYVCELKIDGLAISLFYEKGQLVQAVTRGDGVQGDDVTQNVRTIRSLAQQLHGDYPESFEIRGEIFMHRKGFERLNSERQASGEPPYANPRNVASGSLKIKDSAEVAKRPLDITLYHFLSDDMPFSTHYQAIEATKSWGIKTAPETRVCKGVDAVLQYINEWDTKRQELGFDTDGVVIKVNNLALQEELGFTAKVPRWAIAYKYQTESATTELLGITYQVGRTGAITPVAELNPVHLLGTTVKRASLHNANEIERLDVRVGDIVFVEKGGEIIPKITGVDFSQRKSHSQPTEYIKECPECGTPLIRNEGEAQHYCPNEDGCKPQIIGKIEHFVARKAMDVDSIGSELAAKLVESGLVKRVSDLYKLKADHFIDWAGMGEKSIQNLLEGIKNSKNVGFERLLFGLGIRFVGETVAKKLATSFGSMDKLMCANKEQLVEIDEIGERIADSVVNWFKNPDHLIMINDLKEAGLQLESNNVGQKLSDTLSGFTFVISGVFSKLSRDEAKLLIEANGGKCSGSVSNKTNYLLAGEGMGPAKLQKAEALGVTIISEEDFLKMIQVNENESSGQPDSENVQRTLF